MIISKIYKEFLREISIYNLNLANKKFVKIIQTIYIWGFLNKLKKINNIKFFWQNKI